jgi:transcriptional regulator with XRE-family HTH domain
MNTRLKEARVAAGLNQKEAAQALSVSLGTYRNWEQGRTVMNGEQLVQVSKLFLTDVNYILMLDDIEPEITPKDELVEIYSQLDARGRETLLVLARGLLTVSE